VVVVVVVVWDVSRLVARVGGAGRYRAAGARPAAPGAAAWRAPVGRSFQKDTSFASFVVSFIQQHEGRYFSSPLRSSQGLFDDCVAAQVVGAMPEVDVDGRIYWETLVDLLTNQVISMASCVLRVPVVSP
jgi:hypothetical protein